MTLAELVPDLMLDDAVGAVMVNGITADSREVAPGMVFAALAGAQADGATFIPDAVAKGAVAILAGTEAAVPATTVPVIRDADPRRRLALMAANFFVRQPEAIAAVTGTAGKTSVAEFTRQIAAASGKVAASMGTLGVRGAMAVEGSLTTPDPVTLHRLLADLAEAGVTHLAMEASSHGLDQRRLDGVRVTAAAFTNIGRDHLDYHPTPEAYLAAKIGLFDRLLPDGAALVIDPGAPGAATVLAAVEGRDLTRITVGRSGATIRLLDRRDGPDGQDLRLEVGGETHPVRLPLLGAFQTDNALLAAGLAIGLGIAPDEAVAALAGLEGAPGRLERVGTRRNGARIFVDYAHKPEAIEAVLATLRPLADGKLWVVVGAGGDRDRGKRPLMGAAAARVADHVIVTDDNPRSEDPAAIRAEVIAGAPDALEIGDRAEAIFEAVSLLEAGDILVVAGKGHETGQVIGGVVHPFSDHDVIRAAIDEIDGTGE